MDVRARIVSFGSAALVTRRSPGCPSRRHRDLQLCRRDEPRPETNRRGIPEPPPRLCVEGVLERPLLYLSLYLKRHRDLYYEHLQRVRVEGDWESWIRFFLEAVTSVAGEATTTTQEIVRLIEGDRQKIMALGRATGTALAVYEHATQRVLLAVPRPATGHDKTTDLQGREEPGRPRDSRRSHRASAKPHPLLRRLPFTASG